MTFRQYWWYKQIREGECWSVQTLKLLCRIRALIHQPNTWSLRAGTSEGREIWKKQLKIKFPMKGTRRKSIGTNVTLQFLVINSLSLFTCLQLRLLHLHVYRYNIDPGQLYQCCNKPQQHTNSDNCTSPPISGQQWIKEGVMMNRRSPQMILSA